MWSIQLSNSIEEQSSLPFGVTGRYTCFLFIFLPNKVQAITIPSRINSISSPVCSPPVLVQRWIYKAESILNSARSNALHTCLQIHLHTSVNCRIFTYVYSLLWNIRKYFGFSICNTMSLHILLPQILIYIASKRCSDIKKPYLASVFNGSIRYCTVIIRLTSLLVILPKIFLSHKRNLFSFRILVFIFGNLMIAYLIRVFFFTFLPKYDLHYSRCLQFYHCHCVKFVANSRQRKGISTKGNIQNLTLCVPCIILQCVNDQRDAQFL